MRRRNPFGGRRKRESPGAGGWPDEAPVGVQAGVAQPDAAAATTGGALIAGGLWSTASRVIPQLYTLVLSVAAARFLGPEGMGRQSFIAFVELSAIMLVTAGMPIALMRYVGETVGRSEAERLRDLIAWAWRVEIAGAVVGASVLTGAALLGADPEAAWILAGVVAALGILHTVPSSLLIGTQRWRAASIAGLVTGAFTTGATITVLAAGGGITGMFAVEAVASLLNLVWTSVLARRALDQLAPVRVPAPELRGQVVRYALPASLGALLTFIVWRRSEFFFLERYSTETEIALYSIAFAVVTALLRLFEAVAAVVSPAVATLYGAGDIDRIRSGYGRAIRLVTMLTLPLTAVGLALGPAALRLLYGDDYRGTRPVLLVMLATFPIISVVRTGSALLHGLGRVRLVLIAGFVGAIVNIGLDFALIPRYDAVGAALANGGGQLAVSVPTLLFAARTVGGVPWRPGTLAPAAAAALGAGLAGWACVAFLGGGVGLALGLAAAAAAYALLARLLRILPAEDAAWLDAAAGDRLGGRVGRVSRALARPRSATP